jgi:hypothetical protein
VTSPRPRAASGWWARPEEEERRDKEAQVTR